MITDSIDKDSIRSSSPIIIYDNYKTKKSFLLSCCGCSQTRKNIQIENSKINVQKSFFKRIQFFKAQKRQSSKRKQQLSTSDNNHIIETETFRKHSTSYNSIHNSQSIPFLNRFDRIHSLNNGIDSYSFNDIDIESSINDDKIEQKCFNQCTTPKSFISNKFSSITTNLSAYSTQSLVRKLLDKAQVLDEYYNDISTKPTNQLSSSSNSLLGRSDITIRSYNYLNDKNKKSQRRKYRNLYDNISSDSSRFNLYVDEDNILRELIRFNNDIDLILSRLEMEGENVQQQQIINHSICDVNIIQQTTDVNSQINNQ